MGLVRVTGNGHRNELLSNEVHVVPNQQIDLSIWVKWANIAYTGTNPIAFGVTEYLDGKEGLSVDLDFFTSPAASSSNPAEDNWEQLSATYVTPAAGVDEIRMRFKIGANLTAGTVDWSDAEIIPKGVVRDSVVPGIGTIVDNVANKLFGLEQLGWLHADAGNALGEQNNTVLGHSGQIAAIQASLSAGTEATDTFERTAAATLGADWDENYGTGNGTWDLDGHNAKWDSDDPGGNRESLCRWLGAATTSTTDYQHSYVVLASKATSVTLFSGQAGYNDLIARCDSTEQNYIRFRVGGNGLWSLSKFISGVETVMTSGQVAPPGSGSYIQLICGDKASSTPRFYTATVGSGIVAQGSYGDTTSNFGASYRGWGFGGRAEGDLFSTQYIPGKVNQWSAFDQ